MKKIKHILEEENYNGLSKKLSIIYQDLMNTLSSVTICRHELKEIMQIRKVIKNEKNSSETEGGNAEEQPLKG